MDDRYQFLEALMAAREQLYLSYIGQSIKNNEPIPPSVVVTELLEVVEGFYGAAEVVVKHPLHPFSSRYFTGEFEKLFSYDHKYCQVAQKLQQLPVQGSPWWNGQRATEVEEISIRDLVGFYSNPQRWFVKDCLGIRLEAEVDVVDESELFEHGGLENYLVSTDLLEKIMAEDDLDIALAKLRVTGGWPLGTPGEVSYEKKIKELEGFARIISSSGMGPRCEDLDVDLEVSGYRLRGKIINIHENGILLCRYSKLGGRDLLNGWLQYLLYERVTGEPVDVFILAKDGSRRFMAGSDAIPDLETLVEVFCNGCTQPSQLYIEPGIAWVKKSEKGVGMLEAAEASLAKILENGFDRELTLLLRDCDLTTVLGEEFERLCASILAPIWSKANG